MIKIQNDDDKHTIGIIFIIIVITIIIIHSFIQDEKLSAVQTVFEHSEKNLMKREIPDAYLDKISFNMMIDPVFTPGKYN